MGILSPAIMLSRLLFVSFFTSNFINWSRCGFQIQVKDDQPLVYPGDDVTIYCDDNNKNIQNVVWQNLPTEQSVVQQDGSLKIPNIDIIDTGFYKCKMGETTKYKRVFVTYPVSQRHAYLKILIPVKNFFAHEETQEMTQRAVAEVCGDYEEYLNCLVSIWTRNECPEGGKECDVSKRRIAVTVQDNLKPLTRDEVQDRFKKIKCDSPNMDCIIKLSHTHDPEDIVLKAAHTVLDAIDDEAHGLDLTYSYEGPSSHNYFCAFKNSYMIGQWCAPCPPGQYKADHKRRCNVCGENYARLRTLKFGQIDCGLPPYRSQNPLKEIAEANERLRTPL